MFDFVVPPYFLILYLPAFPPSSLPPFLFPHGPRVSLSLTHPYQKVEAVLDVWYIFGFINYIS